MANGAPASIQRIERLNYVLGGLLVIVGALTQPRSVALGLAVGVALTCVNFFVLRKIVVKWTDDAAAGRTQGGAVLIIPKMIGLMAAVVACLALLPISAGGFIIGYSLFLASIMVEVLMTAIRHTPTANGNDHG